MEENQDRLSFTRQGENGMAVEIVGSKHTLMSMIHAALMSHSELRSIFVPIMTNLMKDDQFLKVMMDDMLASLDNENSDDIIDTE